MTLPDPKTRVGEYLWHWADAAPHAEAAVLADRRLTYRGLADQVERCANALIACAVIGTPDGVFGEVGHAFVQQAPDAKIGAQELGAWCRQQLANYKVPKTFEVMEALPRLAIGKIDKQALAERLRAQLAV